MAHPPGPGAGGGAGQHAGAGRQWLREHAGGPREGPRRRHRQVSCTGPARPDPRGFARRVDGESLSGLGLAHDLG